MNQKRKSYTFFLFYAFSALLLLGCNQQHTETAITVADQTFELASDFSLKTPEGQQVNLPKTDDAIDIYLFWATWCPYCHELMPHLQSIKDEYGDKLNIYAINIQKNGDPAAYIEESGYDFILLMDGQGIAEQYEIEGSPGLLLVDKQNQLRFDIADLLAPAYKRFENLKHKQRSKRIAPWWAGQIRQEIDSIIVG